MFILFFLAMKERFFYWMKFYLGFSGKEGKGFLLLVPFLLAFGLLPTMIRSWKDNHAQRGFLRYQARLDSLETLQIRVVSSPLPTFDPSDTTKTTSKQPKTDHLNRLPFSEADSAMLQIVPGIGPGTAGRIIKYGQQLGGFHSKEQLLEIYGMKDETIAAMWDFFEFDARVFQKIAVNEATLEDFSAHPYISYGDAKVLVAYRMQHGRFSSSEDILKIKIFKEEWVKKLKPYLDFN